VHGATSRLSNSLIDLVVFGSALRSAPVKSSTGFAIPAGHEANRFREKKKDHDALRPACAMLMASQSKPADLR